MELNMAATKAVVEIILNWSFANTMMIASKESEGR